MRFTCEHCGKRYVVKDELLPGRTYRSKCKVCGNVILVKGNQDTGAGPGAGEDLSSVVPVPDSMPSIQRAPSPTTPPSRAAVSSPYLSTPPAPTSSRTPTSPPAPSSAGLPPPPREGYIDLFAGDGLDDAEPLEQPAPTPPPAARRDGIPRGSVPPAATPGRPSPTPMTTITAEVVTPAPGTALAPKQASAPPQPRRRMAPLVIGLAAALIVVVSLGVVAALRPWRSAGTTPTAPTTPVGRPTELAKTPPPPPPAPPRSSEPTPTPPAPAAEAVAAQPSAADAAEESKAARERAEQERAEQERAEQERAEQERAAARAARLERLEKEKAEKAARAKEKADKAAEKERQRLAKLTEGLPPDAVKKVLASNRKAFELCLENPSRGLDKPLEARRVSLRLSVEPAGTVTAAAMDDSTVARAPVGQCLKSAGLALVFPAFRGGPVVVDAPIELPAPPEKEKVAAAPVAPPAAAAPNAGPPLVAVQFSGVSRTESGGEVGDTRYSQKPGDAEISDRQFADGVLTYTGQVGMGNGSAYGGYGFYVNIRPGGQPVDASRFRTVTFKLASSSTKALRVRLQGPEQSVASAGCYPMMILRVTETMKSYRVALEDFAPESYCGGKGRYPEATLPQLVGFEVVDVAVQGKPASFSVGNITLNP